MQSSSCSSTTRLGWQETYLDHNMCLGWMPLWHAASGAIHLVRAIFEIGSDLCCSREGASPLEGRAAPLPSSCHPQQGWARLGRAITLISLSLIGSPLFFLGTGWGICYLARQWDVGAAAPKQPTTGVWVYGSVGCTDSEKIEGRIQKNIKKAEEELAQESEEECSGRKKADLGYNEPPKATTSFSSTGQPPPPLNSWTLSRVQVGLAEAQGARSAMEDASIAVDLTLKTKEGQNRSAALLAICDGHGGDEASRYLKEHFANILQRRLNARLAEDNQESVAVFHAFKEACLEVDQNYWQTLVNSKGWNAGSTLAFALILGNQLYVGNVGDSRVQLCRPEQEPIACTWDQTPDKLKEKIRRWGGRVFNRRINLDHNLYTLAVGRSIGDYGFSSSPEVTGANKVVSPMPKISRYPLQEGDYIVLACDGLYEAFTRKNVHEMVLHYSSEEKHYSPEEISRTLVHAAIKDGRSGDNVSVIVARFGSRV